MTLPTKAKTALFVVAIIIGFLGFALPLVFLCGVVVGTTVAYIIIAAAYFVMRRRGVLSNLEPHVTSINMRRMGIALIVTTMIVLVVTQLDGGWVDHIRGDAYLHQQQNEHKNYTGWETSLLIIDGIILAPIVEEIITRGLIYRSMRHTYGVFASTFTSSAIFMALHANLTQMSYTFFTGMLMCMVYEVTRSLRWPIMTHVLLNIISVIVDFVDAGRHMNGLILALVNIPMIVMLGVSLIFVATWSRADHEPAIDVTTVDA